MYAESHHMIHQQIRSQFPSIGDHDSRVRSIIQEHYYVAHRLNRKIVYESLQKIQKDVGNGAWSGIEFMFKATFVTILLRYHEDYIRAKTVHDFLLVYPEIQHTEEIEQTHLHNFRNIAVIASVCFDPRQDGFASLVLNCCDVDWSRTTDLIATNRRTLILVREETIDRDASISKSSGNTSKRGIQIEDEVDILRATKKYRAEVDRRALARSRSAQAFWRNHCEAMDCGTDIPSVPAPPGLHSSHAHQTHDLPHKRYKSHIDIVDASILHWVNPSASVFHTTPQLAQLSPPLQSPLLQLPSLLHCDAHPALNIIPFSTVCEDK